MKSEIICILDKSGSMSPIMNDAIGGFNSFLKLQKEEEGEATLTLVQFDHEYDKIYDNVDINEVEELTNATYQARGSTALYDAIGKTINEVGARLNSTAAADKPDKVIVAILTDGEENSSLEFTQSQIADMIKLQKEEYSWEVIFLAANQDSFEVGRALNIKAADSFDFQATGAGVRDAYATMSSTVASYRSN